MPYFDVNKIEAIQEGKKIRIESKNLYFASFSLKKRGGKKVAELFRRRNQARAAWNMDLAPFHPARSDLTNVLMACTVVWLVSFLSICLSLFFIVAILEHLIQKRREFV